MPQIELEIVTPNRLFFSGTVDRVTVPGREGYMGILPGHAPLLSELKTGIISFTQGDQQTRLYSGWGFVEVLPDRVSVLTEDAAHPAEIDVEKALTCKDQAEKMLHSHDPGSDYQAAMRLLEESTARLEAVNRQGTL